MLAAGRVGLLFGDNGLGALLRVRDDVKSRRLGEKKKKVCSTHLHCSTNKSNNNIKRTPARLGARTTPVVGTTSAFKVAGVTMTALAGAAKGAVEVEIRLIFKIIIYYYYPFYPPFFWIATSFFYCGFECIVV